MAKDIELSKEDYLRIQEATKNIKPARSLEVIQIGILQRDMAADPEMWRDKPEPVQPPGRKIGEEHLKSWLKLGAHELTQALAAFPDSNIRPAEEPGVFGNESIPHLRDPGLGSDYEQTLQQYASRPSSDPDRSRTR